MRWRVVHVPTPEYAAAWLTPLPHYLLTAGLLLSFALGVMAIQLRISSSRARTLAAGNRALEVSASELRRLNEVLEARVAERTAELEAFNHSISHDLKSPLGAILNYTSILESDYCDKLDPEAIDILARIRRSARRGAELLNGLLRLSRASHSALAITDIDMNTLARESFAQARGLEPDCEVEFVLDPVPRALGDRALIAEVLVNLFDNAIKYTRDREKRRVTMRGMVENGECVYEVADNGLGFDMRYADKLFRVFERLHSSPDIPGTGVGLAVVASIIKRHQGRVWAEGELEVGSRFMFTLPRANS
jgi:signal transduction histidine kinase